MSNSPNYQILRKGEKNDESKMKDSMIIDGLVDVYNKYHMGVTAENVAEKYQITRKQQDEFAINSLIYPGSLKNKIKILRKLKTNI